MGDDTLEFVECLRSKTENEKLKKILDCIVNSSPSEDFAYGDWNDRQDFMESEYDGLVAETVRQLEEIVTGVKKEIPRGMRWNDYPSDTLYLWNGKTLFVIAEGTGDNLWQEDIDAGYNDYWMTESYGEDGGDGGQWLEKTLIHDINYTIQGVMDRMMECDLWDDSWVILDPEYGEELRRELE